jgi:hypothetical protein
MPQRAATIAEVRARLGSAFTDPPITDDVVQLALDDTACFVAPEVWGACASTAHAYAAAHFVASSPAAGEIEVPAGMGQVLTSAKDGPASYTLAAPPTSSTDEGAWSLTGWGRRFLEYRKVRWGTGSALAARTSATARRAC